MKDLLKYLPNRAERVEFPSLHLVEQSAELGIVGDGLFEVSLRPGRSDREDLTGEVLSAPLVQQPVRLEVGAVRGDLFPELLDALLLQRVGQDDRRTPGPLLP